MKKKLCTAVKTLYILSENEERSDVSPASSLRSSYFPRSKNKQKMKLSDLLKLITVT